MSHGLVLQTQDNCPPGLVRQWAQARRLDLDTLRVDRWDRLPSPSNYSFGVLLGSGASLTATGVDWVDREVEWIADADAAGLPLLGICFGAQALAAALGGAVVRLPTAEHAWIELHSRDPQRIPEGPWVALHEDAITPPPDAQELARNEFGLQAFSLRAHLGVQFHPEATPSILARWVADKGGRFKDDLLLDAAAQYRRAADSALALFDSFMARSVGVLAEAI